MDSEGDLPASLRLLLAMGIVFGVIAGGILFVYNWIWLAPIVLVGGFAYLGYRWLFHRGSD